MYMYFFKCFIVVSLSISLPVLMLPISANKRFHESLTLLQNEQNSIKSLLINVYTLDKLSFIDCCQKQQMHTNDNKQTRVNSYSNELISVRV